MTKENNTPSPIGKGDRRIRRGNQKRRLNSRFAKLQTIKIEPKDKWIEKRIKVNRPIFYYTLWTDRFSDGTERIRINSKGEYLYKKILAGYEEKIVIVKRIAKPKYKTIIQYNYPPEISKKIFEYRKQIEEEKRKREEEQKKLEEHYKKNKVCPTCKKRERGKIEDKLCTDPWHTIHEQVKKQKEKTK